MFSEKKKGKSFYSFGIILSIVFVVLSLIWVVLSGLKEDKADDLTWVG